MWTIPIGVTRVFDRAGKREYLPGHKYTDAEVPERIRPAMVQVHGEAIDETKPKPQLKPKIRLSAKKG